MEKASLLPPSAGNRGDGGRRAGLLRTSEAAGIFLQNAMLTRRQRWSLEARKQEEKRGLRPPRRR